MSAGAFRKVLYSDYYDYHITPDFIIEIQK